MYYVEPGLGPVLVTDLIFTTSLRSNYYYIAAKEIETADGNQSVHIKKPENLCITNACDFYMKFPAIFF